MVLFSVLPTLVVGLCLRQSVLQIAIRTAIAFVSYWIVFALAMAPFMGAAVCSNPARSNANDPEMLIAACLGFVPQLLYILGSLSQQK